MQGRQSCTGACRRRRKARVAASRRTRAGELQGQSGGSGVVRIRIRRSHLLHVFAAHALRARRILVRFVQWKEVLVAGLVWLRLMPVGGLVAMAVRPGCCHDRLLSMRHGAQQVRRDGPQRPCTVVNRLETFPRGEFGKIHRVPHFGIYCGFRFDWSTSTRMTSNPPS